MNESGEPGLDVGDIGNAITNYHDGDRREDQVPLLRNSGDLAEEGIEIRERVGGRKPPSQIRFDLRDIPSGEFVDGTKRLGLAALFAADRRDEEVPRGRQPTKLVDMAVEVVRQERHGVLVPGMTERAARVDADEEGVARFRLSRIGGPSRRCRGHDAGGGERRGEDPPQRGHRAAERDLHSWRQDWDGGQ